MRYLLRDSISILQPVDKEMQDPFLIILIADGDKHGIIKSWSEVKL
jgi:hypothetical protein